MKKYFFDTCIWIDLYESRLGFNNEPLGEHAFNLIRRIIKSGCRIVISDLTLKELEMNYSEGEIKALIKPFESFLEKTYATKEQIKEAKRISIKRNLPAGDVLHALIAKENFFLLVTRDKHFRQLKDLAKPYKPEEIY